MAQTGIDKKQLKNWFTNARRRIWKPMQRSAASHDYDEDGGGYYEEDESGRRTTSWPSPRRRTARAP